MLLLLLLKAGKVVMERPCPFDLSIKSTQGRKNVIAIVVSDTSIVTPEFFLALLPLYLDA